ncbi:MAG: lipopolysaccharide assembly protein LapB [Xanthomonadaceae bacterium]|nr:lipopolysaccharide assembly protein LapB [Xanthomonadaceae bacterium]
MPTDQSLLLVLVLVAAVAVGWLLRAFQARKPQTPAPGLSDDYFRGLNYLLNEEPDKAVEVFIRMIEVDSETVETHFALASLFRRRGEVDRAIRIHQNLIARPNLSRPHRLQALYELGDDYMRAGLFDRAETLFNELSESGAHVGPALRQLMAIYEQQRDWEQAIATAQRLELVDGRSQQRVIAHYWCELAAVASSAGQQRRAMQLARKAQGADPSSPRAGILTGELLEETGDPAAALRAYHGVIEHDPAFAGEVLPSIAQCFSKLGDRDGFDRFLVELRQSKPATAPYVAMAAFHEPSLRSREILGFISQYLKTRGQGLARLLDRLVEQRSLEPEMEVDSARELVRLLLEDHPRYLCGECGLPSNTLYWQCPSCRAWSSVKPHVDPPYAPSASALPEGTGRR